MVIRTRSHIRRTGVSASIACHRLHLEAKATPAVGQTQELVELRDSDFPYVRVGIANRWVPQVSSKRVGLVAAGKTWTSADILRDHLALRQRFGGARLVWSGHWTTFSGPDFWVTVVGPAQPTAAEANR